MEDEAQGKSTHVETMCPVCKRAPHNAVHRSSLNNAKMFPPPASITVTADELRRHPGLTLEAREYKLEPQGLTSRTVDVGLWTLVPTTTTPKASCPQQNNGCDCGLFTCMAADYIANNQLDLAYGQGAMPAFRRRMAARIIAGTLDAEEARQPGAPLRSECL